MGTFKESSVRGFQDERFNLTPREDEILRRLAKGRLYKEIANELGISVSAVHKHQHNLFQKLQVENRTEAAVKWIEIKNHAPTAPNLWGLESQC